ncbi:metal-binding protein [Acaryochloris sp. IP29b_bin.148]|uniref:metal-binding protein n=1 Tax=Acaryochloris sp. IP29b_bin.148 TaxID=2969218 RepID=UPI0026023719|nr:metal-binding protein [Acaryochloris sp. IP29b_bin.148]
MPSGRTHDQITLGMLPGITIITLVLSRSASLTLSLSSAFLFSGLMFGPDLDIYSVQYKRWGWLRGIWLPYQKLLHHRSWLSHGPIIGTLLRLFYLGLWLGMGAALTGVLLTQVGDISIESQSLLQQVEQYRQRYLPEGLAILLGLELGAMSHSFSDGLSSLCKSTFKRLKF